MLQEVGPPRETLSAKTLTSGLCLDWRGTGGLEQSAIRPHTKRCGVGEYLSPARTAGLQEKCAIYKTLPPATVFLFPRYATHFAQNNLLSRNRPH